MSETGPQIQIDDDWKAQAQREKEALAQKQKAAQAAAPASAGTGTTGAAAPSGRGAGPRELPPADFDGLINTLASQALMYLGAMPDAQGRAYVSLETARHQIDLLGVIEDKTQGNLTDEEAKSLGATLYELRQAYVSVSQMVRDQALGKTPPR